MKQRQITDGNEAIELEYDETTLLIRQRDADGVATDGFDLISVDNPQDLLRLIAALVEAAMDMDMVKADPEKTS